MSKRSKILGNLREDLDQKINDMTPERRDDASKAFERTSENLLETRRDTLNTLTKLLFTINAGGAVAVLAFIGTMQNIGSLHGPFTALGCYILGVVFVASFHVLRLIHLNKMIDGITSDVEKWLLRQLGWLAVLYNHEKRKVGGERYP